jgi:hypothetical protein
VGRRISIDFSDRAVDNYLKQNSLQRALLVLHNQTILSHSRVLLLQETAQRYRNYILQGIDSSSNMTDSIAKLHVTQLDLIAGIFMLLEDYIAYSHHLRRSLTDLPKTIVSKNIGLISNEIAHLKKLKLGDIRGYLLFPSLHDLNLGKEDRKFVSQVLRNIAKDIHNKIREITKFYQLYYRVYIKYKHIFTAVVGQHQAIPSPYNPLQKEVVSHLYVRDHNEGRACTYIVPTTLEALEYYESIIEDIGVVFDNLLTTYIHSMLNMGKPFLIPTEYFLKNESIDQVERWHRIVRDINHVPILLPKQKFNIILGGNLLKRLNKVLPKQFIYKLNRDIFLQ